MHRTGPAGLVPGGLAWDEADQAQPVWRAIQTATTRATINAQHITAPTGPTATLLPYLNSAVRMRLRLARGSLIELNANIEAQPDRWAVIGGPPYNDGVLIIVIWAHPNPG